MNEKSKKTNIKVYNRSIRFSKYQGDGIKKIANKWGTDFSDVVRYIVQLYIDGYLKDDKNK